MNKLNEQQQGEIERLANMPESAIDTSDIPEISDFSRAEQGRFFRPVKKQITIRLDADVLAWFRNLEGKYQSQINMALREYMKAHR